MHFSLFHILHHFTLSCLNMRFMVFHLPHPLILSVYISSCCSTLPFFFSLSQHLTVSVFFFFSNYFCTFCTNFLSLHLQIKNHSLVLYCIFLHHNFYCWLAPQFPLTAVRWAYIYSFSAKERSTLSLTSFHTFPHYAVHTQVLYKMLCEISLLKPISL